MDLKDLPDFQQRARIPIIDDVPDVVERGIVAAWGENWDDWVGRWASAAVLLLKGGKPSGVPDESARLSLALNVRSAREMGLAIPPALLARADRVID